MPNTDIYGRVAANAALRCSARGCNKPRSDAALHCQLHRRRARDHGHPEGRRIWPKEYAQERLEVAQLLAKERDHPAIRAGIALVREAMDDAIASTSRGAARPGGTHELARIARAGVTPEAILAEAAAVFLFAQRRPYALPDDARLTFAMGYAVSLLAPRRCLQTRRYASGQVRRFYKPTRGPVRRGLGTWLREGLAPLLVNFQHAAERAQALPQKRRRAMAVPLVALAATSGALLTTKDDTKQ